MKFQDYGQVCHLQRPPSTDTKAFGLGNPLMLGRVSYDRHQKLPARMFAQLTESLNQAMSKSKAQPTIEQKILSRFSQISEAHSLEDCLQFCLEQYTEKQQQLTAALQIGIQLQQILEGLQQVNCELHSKCADLEDQVQVQDLEWRKLEVSNLGLEREIVRLRNANAYLEMECEAERHHRNEAIKEALRQTYESDKEEMDKMTDLVRALERDIERKEKRIIDQENERGKLNKEIKQSKCVIEDLTFENRKLKKEIVSLSKQLIDLEKLKYGHAQEKSVRKQERSPTYYKDRLNQIKEPNTFPKMILLKDGGPLLLEKNIIRKLNSKSAQKRKEEPETPTEKGSCFLQSESGNSSAKKRRNIQKMKSMNHPCFIEDQAKSHQQTSTNEPINHIPASIRGHKQDSEPKAFNDKFMYRVKSFQRLSEFSEAGRLSGALYNNLGDECEDFGNGKKKEVKDMKSIGLMTQPNEEDQYIYSKDFESPMNSPLRRSPSPTRKFTRTNLHRSCLLTNGVIPEQKFFSAIRYNKNIQKESSKEEKSQGNASNFLASLVTRRTHKKKEQQSIMEIEERRKEEQKGRQRLSKSFIDTFKAIKETLVPSTPSANKVKREQKKYLSMSMINFEKESPEEKKYQKPQPNMKKKNTSLLVSSPGQEQKAASSILDSLVNFTVKRRIKR